MPAVIEISTLTARFPQVSARPSGDCPAFNVPASVLLEVMRFLRDEQGFDLLTDITGMDWGVNASPRFGVIYHLVTTKSYDVIRLATECTATEPPAVPSVVSIWPAAEWHEREAYDFFGIRFEGHPDLRRILMWDSYPHHPLRKDFPLAGIETPLPDDEIQAETGTKVMPAPMAGGPFVAPQQDFVSKREPRARDESWNEKKPKPGS
ncbi:MAG: NADH-quinone oxidoreductase subunit C [Opitutaceae bacterium]|nr:NADH-quinone oxidoreductase subunit C [Opitutaceae bacterium]